MSQRQTAVRGSQPALWAPRFRALRVLRGSDGRHKPVHVPRVRGGPQVAARVGDRSRGAAVLGEGA